MPLPELIEITPLAGPVDAEIAVPGSKSITNRALVLAALATGQTTLRGALWSEDTRIMVEALRRLGFVLSVEPDGKELSNRTIQVEGNAGRIPQAGSPDAPLDLFVGNAGTAARFLAALVCLGQGSYRLHGVGRMHERPQAALFQALRQLGYRVDSPNNRLPAVIHGRGPQPGRCTVAIEESSQFASALLLCSRAGGWEIETTDGSAEESAYVAMTRELLKFFPEAGGLFHIEPDASSGSYFLAADALQRHRFASTAASIRVAHWPASRWQIDADFPRYLPLPAQLSRRTQLGDSIMTAVVLAPFADRPVRFTDLGRLRVQECERVLALRTELTRCGAVILETGDTLEVFPSVLKGAEIETYGDHRVAMCFAVLGLHVAGMHLRNPACVAKTFPDFFRKLHQPPPDGLGVALLEGFSRRPLTPDELAAPLEPESGGTEAT